MTAITYRPRYRELLVAGLTAEIRSPFCLVTASLLYCYVLVLAFGHGQEIAAERGPGTMSAPIVLAVVGTAVLFVLAPLALGVVGHAAVALWVHRAAKSAGVSVELRDDAIWSTVGSRPGRALPYRKARVLERGTLIVICTRWTGRMATLVPARAFRSAEERAAFRRELESRMSQSVAGVTT